MAISTYLILGGYTFTGFGVPETINGGGAHKLVVHKLLGGTRVIDALGADDDQIVFEGRFRGADAMDQARLMDAIRRSGTATTLQYWNFTANVVVCDFKWNYQRFFEVPYSLKCEVISTNATANGASPITQDAAIGSDLTLSGQLAGNQ